MCSQATEPPQLPQLSRLQSEVFQLHAVLDTVAGFIYTKDLAGNYTYANKSVRDLFGLPLAAIIGRHDREFWDAATVCAITANDALVVESGQTVTIEETNLRTSNGETRIYLSQKSPLYDDHGQLVGLCGISTDITERKRLERELEENRNLLQTVLNNLDAFVYMKDPSLRFLYINDKTAELFGKTSEEVIGRSNYEVLPQEVADHFSETDRKVFAEGKKQLSEEHSYGADGKYHHYWSHKIPLFRNGQAYAYLGFSTDVTELHEAREALRKLSITDSLTELHNRRYFMDSAQREFSRARRYQQPLALISIDIDHFKRVNDRYGHPAGDVVLCQISKILREQARESDLLARIGGEEFLLLLPNTEAKAALILAERIRKRIAERAIALTPDAHVHTTVSIGVSALTDKDVDFDSMLLRADRALYQAKEHGRNMVVSEAH